MIFLHHARADKPSEAPAGADIILDTKQSKTGQTGKTEITEIREKTEITGKTSKIQ